MRSKKLGVAATSVVGLSILCSHLSTRAADDALSPSEVAAVAEEAYVYLYSLITMDITRRQLTEGPPGAAAIQGPANAFVHVRAYPDANFRAVVRPNFDTLYSSAWLDLTDGPVIVTAPDTDGRYYLLPLLDMWTDVFAVPGKRTSGTKEAKWGVVPNGWIGTLPEGVQRIDSPTPYVWLIGRIQTNGPDDYAAVHKIQDGLAITPLSQWGMPASPPKVVLDPTVDMKTPPLVQVNTMSAQKYFTYGMELLAKHPPHITDWSIVERMKRIGLVAGKFEVEGLSPEVRGALEQGAAAGLKTMQQKVSSLARVVNGWSMNTDTMGVYGDYYLKRAIVSMVGLGANQCEDAVYPMCLGDSDGKPLMGQNKYVLHFSKDELPPVDAFWSVTMYDAEGFQTANPINRFAIGDRDALKFNPDGSLDLYLQHASPGAERESNWLPSPASGELGVTMRLYAPKASVLEGVWVPPPVKRVE